MPLQKTPAPRNRKLSKADPTTDSSPSPTAKRRKLDNQQQHRTPSSFWDNLSRLWFTRRALREFDRRTVWPAAPVLPARTGKENIHLAQLKRFARHGGPSLINLRAYPEPGTTTPHRTMSSSPSGSRKRARTERESDTPLKNRRTSAYDPGFEQHLVDHGVYPEGYGGRSNVQEPHNWEEIHARLAMRRASLSPSSFSHENFWDFKDKNRDALTENTVMSTVFPIITGSARIPSQENVLFGNLKNLTDGSIVKAKPNFYDGTRPEELHKRLRADLGPSIVPSTNTEYPCLPNFFTEGKGHDGSPVVCERQALYDGALGARGFHELRSYVDGETSYDNNAYTITSTYHGGTGVLKICTMHPTPSTKPENVFELRQNQLKRYFITDNPDTFRQGASAFRNAREWAQEKRKALIAAANGKASTAESSGPDLSTHNFRSPTNESIEQESDTWTDELTLDYHTPASSSHGTEAKARKDFSPKVSSSQHSTRNLAKIPENPRGENG